MRIICLSRSEISADPRVLKWAQTFAAHGYDVTTIGWGEAPAEVAIHANWSHIRVSRMPSGASGWKRVTQVMREDKVAGLLSKIAINVAVLRGASLSDEDQLSLWKRLCSDADAFEAACRSLSGIGEKDIVIANDWDTLPLAEAMAARSSCHIWYDSHEYASEQFLYNRRWRLRTRPVIMAIERSAISRVKTLTSVSKGLVDSLAGLYSYQGACLAVRNIPDNTPVAPLLDRDHSPLRLLYQGVMQDGRGLDELIAAVENQAGLTLALRGPGSDLYLSKLQARVASIANIEILPPVAPRDMILAAAKYDMGVMLLPPGRAQTEYALPNKLFEYIYAGLGLFLTRRTEMVTLGTRYQNALFTDSLRVQDVRLALSTLTPATVTAYRRASHAATKHLSWQAEQQALLQRVADIHSSAQTDGQV